MDTQRCSVQELRQRFEKKNQNQEKLQEQSQTQQKQSHDVQKEKQLKIDNEKALYIQEQSQTQQKQSHDVQKEKQLQIDNEKATYIQKFYRNKKLQKKKKKKEKNRFNSIKELISTESNYFDFLDKIYSQLIPKAQNILQQNDFEIMFQQIIPLFQLHKQFLEEIKAKFQNYKLQKLIFDTIEVILPMFKIYYEISSNFENKMQIYNRTIKDLTEQVCNIQDIFYKPIQRLPQYVMLFKQIKQNTETDHPDYQNIERILQQFSNINDENDKRMQENDICNQIIAIQQRFPKLDIVNNVKKYYFCFEMFQIDGAYKYPVECIFFDKLVVIDNKYKNESQVLQFTNKSFIKQLVNRKYWQNMFIIYGKEGGFIFSSEQRESIYKQIKQNILTESENVYKVDVISSALRIDKNNQIYTCYIIEIEYKDFTQRLFLRHKQLTKIEQKAAQYNLDVLDIAKPHFNLSYTKLVEYRIQIFQSLIQHLLVQDCEGRDLIIQDLKLVKQQDFIEQKNEINLGGVSYFFKMLQEKKIKRIINLQKSFQSSKNILIKTPYDTFITVPYNQFTRVRDVIYQTLEQLKINFCQDFRLIHVQKELQIILDYDEFIFNLFKQDKSFFRASIQQYSYFLIQKTFILPLQYEIKDLTNQYQKFQFLIHQQLQNLQNLDINDYIAILSLYIYGQRKQNNDEEAKSIIKKFIPAELYRQGANLKAVKQLITKIDFQIAPPMLKRLSQELGFDLSKLPCKCKNYGRKLSNCCEESQTSYDRKSSQQSSNQQQENEEESYYYEADFYNDKSQTVLETKSKPLYETIENKSLLQFENKNTKYQFRQSIQKIRTSIFQTAKEIKKDYDFKEHFDQYYNIVQKNLILEQQKITFNEFLSQLAILQIIDKNQQLGYSYYKVTYYKKNKKKIQDYHTDFPSDLKLMIYYDGIRILNLQGQFIYEIKYRDIKEIRFDPKSISIKAVFEILQTKSFRFDSTQVWDIQNLIQEYMDLKQIYNEYDIQNYKREDYKI